MTAAKTHTLRLLGALGKGLPPDRWLPPNAPFLPFYHAVGTPADLPHIRHLYRPRDAAEFRADIEYIARHFTPVDLPAFLRMAETGDFRKGGKPVFHLSFDDGLRQVYDIAMPVLEKMGIPATIFVNPDFVDNRALFFRYKVSLLVDAILNKKDVGIKIKNKTRTFLLSQSEWSTALEDMANENALDFEDFLEKYRPYMTLPQLKDALRRGFSVGAHSMNHPYYSKINESEQIQQTEHSLDWVGKHLTPGYRVFSFPFTDDGVGEGFFRHIAPLSDATFACAGIKASPYKGHWQRLGMENSSATAAGIVMGECLYRWVRG